MEKLLLSLKTLSYPNTIALSPKIRGLVMLSLIVFLNFFSFTASACTNTGFTVSTCPTTGWPIAIRDSRIKSENWSWFFIRERDDLESVIYGNILVVGA